MEEIKISSWKEFADAVETVRSKYGEAQDKVLFRGQADESWQLLTTLERKSDEDLHVSSYLTIALRTKHELESFTGKLWNTPGAFDADTEIREKQDTFHVHLPAYDYLVYLRHHGFPSPLLDWSESPYIAAFFAYAESVNTNPAVYCYIERPVGVKMNLGGQPKTSVKGPFVSTHKRHFAQKAWYTIATRWDHSSERHVFCNHSDVFTAQDPDIKQDVLVKITLPNDERKTALKALSDYNINHFTLFQSEDSLIKALEYKLFDLKS